jgi:predicted aspartyl protease
VQNVPALIDTGATLSCIDDALAQQLQLPLINQTQSVGAHGQGPLNVYLAYIAVPGLNAVQAGEFIGAIMNVSGQIHRALIGRSLLQNMLLVYDGRSGSVKLAN